MAVMKQTHTGREHYSKNIYEERIKMTENEIKTYLQEKKTKEEIIDLIQKFSDQDDECYIYNFLRGEIQQENNKNEIRSLSNPQMRCFMEYMLELVTDPDEPSVYSMYEDYKKIKGEK